MEKCLIQMRDDSEEVTNRYEDEEEEQSLVCPDSRRCEIHSIDMKEESMQTIIVSESISTPVSNRHVHGPIQRGISDDACHDLYNSNRSASISSTGSDVAVHRSEEISQGIIESKSLPERQEVASQKYGMRVRVTVTQQDSPGRLIPSCERDDGNTTRQSLSTVPKKRRDGNEDAEQPNDIFQEYEWLVGPSNSTLSAENRLCHHDEMNFLPSLSLVEDHSESIKGTKEGNTIKDQEENEKESHVLEDWLERIVHDVPDSFLKTSPDLDGLLTLPLSMLDDALDNFTDSKRNSNEREVDCETDSITREESVMNNQVNSLEDLVESVFRWASSIPRNVDEDGAKPNHVAVPRPSTHPHKTAYSDCELIQTPSGDKCGAKMEDYAVAAPYHEERTREPPRIHTSATLSVPELTETYAGLYIDRAALENKDEKSYVKSKHACRLLSSVPDAGYILTDLALPQCRRADSPNHNSDSDNMSPLEHSPSECRNEDEPPRSSVDSFLRDGTGDEMPAATNSPGRNGGTRQKNIPPVRHPFPPNKKQQKSRVIRDPDSSFTVKDIHPRNMIIHGCEANPDSRQTSKWFLVRRIRRSLQRRWRKDEKNLVHGMAGYEAIEPQDLTPVSPLIPTPRREAKKSVRFDDDLTQVHMFDQTGDCDSQEDESRSMFNYYYDLLSWKEGRWSVDDDEYSYEDASTEGENHCFIEFASSPSFVCREFAMKGENKTHDDEDSILE